MKLNFFYPFDEVVANGSVVSHSESGKGYEIEKEFFDVLDLIVIRHIGDSDFEISLNQLFEAKLKAIMMSSVQNKRQRLYTLLRTREVSAVDDFVTRVMNKEYSSEGLAFGITEIWGQIATTGNYKESVEDRTISLDHLINVGILEYDTHCYYSMTNKFGDGVKRHGTIPLNRAMTVIKGVRNIEDTSNILRTIGYEFSPTKLQFEIQKEDTCEVASGFLV